MRAQSGYWQRAFASKTDRDLWLGCSGATVIVFVILTVVGFSKAPFSCM